MTEAFISTDGHGNMTAECCGIVLYLDDAGLSRAFYYGDTIYLPRDPDDVYDLADMLEMAA